MMQAYQENQENNKHQLLTQYFTFMLGGEEYGFNILSVLEIRGLERLTAIPSAPAYIKGVLNLRGAIIPIMDLRARFGMDPIEYTRSTVVVILRVNQNEQMKDIGLIVDAVSDVYSIDSTSVKPKPDICNNANQDYILGITSIEIKHDDEDKEIIQDKLIIILDANKLVDLQEVHLIEQDASQAKHEKN